MKTLYNILKPKSTEDIVRDFKTLSPFEILHVFYPFNVNISSNKYLLSYLSVYKRLFVLFLSKCVNTEFPILLMLYGSFPFFIHGIFVIIFSESFPTSMLFPNVPLSVYVLGVFQVFVVLSSFVCIYICSRYNRFLLKKLG